MLSINNANEYIGNSWILLSSHWEKLSYQYFTVVPNDTLFRNRSAFSCFE